MLFVNVLRRLFGADKRLSKLEMTVLDSVKAHLDPRLVPRWASQIASINKIQRLADGVEVNFYRMKNGRPSFDEVISFPNKTEELLLARVRVELPGSTDALTVKVWCVNGFLFSLEYVGNVGFFEEAAGMDPPPRLVVHCELLADLHA